MKDQALGFEVPGTSRRHRIDRKLQALVGVALLAGTPGLVIGNRDPVGFRVERIQAVDASDHFNPADLDTKRSLCVEHGSKRPGFACFQKSLKLQRPLLQVELLL